MGCYRAEFLFFKGESENIMISRKIKENCDVCGGIFCFLHLKIGNSHQKIRKYHSFWEHNYLVIQEMFESLSNWAEVLPFRAFLGIFCKISTPES